jgi:DNA-binding IclR family transcriptional regulator
MPHRPAEPWIDTLTRPKDRPEGAQSIRRALLLLRILASAEAAGLGLTEIARAAGLTRPTTHRLLGVLVSEGLIEQRPRTRRYGTIPHDFRDAPRPDNSPLLRAAAVPLAEAAEEIGDTVFLTLHDGLETVCVARQLGSYPIQVLVLEVGARRPLGISSAGIAILASLQPSVSRRLLASNARHLPLYGFTMDGALAAVAAARTNGYALRERGLVAGTRALSLAFAQQNRAARAALTVAAISRRLQASRLSTVLDCLRGCADKIERSMREQEKVAP